MNKWIGIALAGLAIVTVAFVVFAAIDESFRVIARDISIVLLAVFQMISAILSIAILVAVLFAIQYLRKLSEQSIIPKIDTLTTKVENLVETTSGIAGNVQTTTSTVSNTTGYVAERVVSPIIRVSGLFAGARAAASYLARRDTDKDLDAL